MKSAPAAIAIVGVGNTMRHDDGIGPIAISRLAASGIDLGDVELITLDGEAARLVEAWRDRRRVIVVDAVVSGQRPGSVRRVDLNTETLPSSVTMRSSHGAGVAEAVALARCLGTLPDQLILIGAESVDFSLGEGLSAEVEASLPGLLQCLIAEACA